MLRLLLGLIAFAASCTGPPPAVHAHVALPTLDLLTADPDAVSFADLAHAAADQERHFSDFCQWHGVVFAALRLHPDDAEPEHFDTGGDAALFTGFALATSVYRFATTHASDDLERVLRELEGVHLLTHVSGTPGVLVRCAFSWEERARWCFPGRWNARMFSPEEAASHDHPGPYLYFSPDALPDVLQDHGLTLFGQEPLATWPRMLFYARTTRDQFTGVIFGLAVAWKLLAATESDVDAPTRARVAAARAIVGGIARNLLDHLESDARVRRSQATEPLGRPDLLEMLDLRLVDQRGNSGALSNDVAGRLKLSLFALNREVAEEELERSTGSRSESLRRRRDELASAFEQTWRAYFRWNADGFVNRFHDSYFPWNLRWTQTFTLWLLSDSERRSELVDYCESTQWPYVRDDGNVYFTFLRAAMRGGAGRGKEVRELAVAITNLKGLALRPLRSYSSPLFGTKTDGRPQPAHLRQPSTQFLWQKDPAEVGGEEGEAPDAEGLHEATGLSLLLPYWIGRFHGLLPER